jgi:hypothetical protein
MPSNGSVSDPRVTGWASHGADLAVVFGTTVGPVSDWDDPTGEQCSE